MKTNVTFISVVRDRKMYDACLLSNPHVNGHILLPIDNTIENGGIPFRYNQVLNSYDYSKPTWFVFCHEDFEFKEDIGDKLCTLDKNALYGAIGAISIIIFRLVYLWKSIGLIQVSHKDGTGLEVIGNKAPDQANVETFDGCCLIVHSDLIQKNSLRFDEHLSFDLYAEDFCIYANENHHIPSKIINFNSHHWSKINVAGDRFYNQLRYLNNKYAHCCYTSLCAYNVGHPNPVRWLNYSIRSIIRSTLNSVKRVFSDK